MFILNHFRPFQCDLPHTSVGAEFVARIRTPCEDSIRKFIKKLGSPKQLRACYEAGPTGFVVYWQLTQL
jgi:hypothetical protein